MIMGTFQEEVEKLKLLPLKKRMYLFIWVRVHGWCCMISGNFRKRFVKSAAVKE